MFNNRNNKKISPYILWLEILKSQLGSEGKMNLLINGNHGQQSKTTIYGIYKVLELQEKFGLDVIEIRNLVCGTYTNN